MKRIFKICIPHTHRDFFDYFSQDLHPVVGARVWVPFRKQRRLGIVLGEGAPKQGIVLKAIDALIDEEAFLSADILALCQWIARYYQAPMSEVLALAIPKKYRLGGMHGSLHTVHYQLMGSLEEALRCISPRAKRQQALLHFLAQEPGMQSAIKNIRKAGFSEQQAVHLCTKGVLMAAQKEDHPWLLEPLATEPLLLNLEQKAAVAAMLPYLNSYHAFLLYGVTGSGKTEVYLELISQVLSMGRQVLVLVPEIGLTPQLLQRFRRRIHAPMAVVHSHLGDLERQNTWFAAHKGSVRLIIGTRAALFTPLPQLGLIVVDEEHDASLKQMEGVRYSARDAALVRARWHQVPIVLGSATPSLESLYNAQIHKYTLLRLTQKALTEEPLQYQILDARNQHLEHGIAEPALKLIEEHLEQDKQVLVFINRRGYAPVLLCHQCGWMADCHACDAHLTLHRQKERLICHHCGRAQKEPTQCPRCFGKELLAIGVGTQKIHEFLQERFKKHTVLRVDRDSVRKKQDWEHYIRLIHEGEAQLLVGTQMLAKGHHFPNLSLVLVLDVDNGFYNHDFRALERLGQLLTQVAGRAGRALHRGHVVIQTHVPQHPLLNILVREGYDAFAAALLLEREQASLPPYQFLSLLRAEAKDIIKLKHFLSTAKKMLQEEGMLVLGPAPAPLARKAGYHQMHLLLKSNSRAQRGKALEQFRQGLEKHLTHNKVRWSLDVDPVDLG